MQFSGSSRAFRKNCPIARSSQPTIDQPNPSVGGLRRKTYGTWYMKISATTPADVYDEAFAKMHAILGNGDEPGTLCGDLHNACDKALVVFRDLLDAAVCAQAGAYRSVKDAKDPRFVLVGGVEFNVDHAEHELGLCIGALRRAKIALEAELSTR